jgi:hypothetical protein
VNLCYFRDRTVRWIGVEANVFMDRYLREEATRLGMAIDLRW